MIKLVIVLFLIFNNFSVASSCEVQLANYIIKKSKSKESEQIAKNCPQSIHDLINSLVLNNKDISTDFLKEAISKEELNADIRFNHEKISIYSLELALSKLASQTQMKIVKFTDPHGLPSQSKVLPTIECELCNQVGTTTYKIILNDRTYYGEVQVGIAIPAFSVKKNAFQGSIVEPENLIITQIITSQPEQYISDKNQLRFSKFTRNISTESILKRSDVIKETIVSNLRNVAIIIDSAGLSIKGSGTSQASGSFGDIIPVKMGSSGKIVNAQIIGKDLMRIEL